MTGSVEDRVRTALENCSRRRRYLVAVSGGLDSSVLVELLIGLGYEKLVLVHLNHRLRGRASGADAAFVRRLARRHGLDVEVAAEDVNARSVSRGISLETAGREARYAFFAESARQRRCPRILLAHHADDQVETVLMSLFRGAGPRGLSGMSFSHRRRVGKTDLELIRPLLDCWREELERYALESGVKFREDASNQSMAFVRNRIRHELIPDLCEFFGRDIRPLIRRTEIQQRNIQSLLDSLSVASNSPGPLSLGEVRSHPVALQRNRLYCWLRANAVSDLSFELIEQIRSVAESSGKPASVNIPGDHRVRRRRGELFICKQSQE